MSTTEQLKKQSKQSRSEILGVGLIFSATILVDQCSKSWAKATLRSHDPTDYLGGIFRLEYAENPGAFLGFGGTLSPELRFWIFTVLVAGFLTYASVMLGLTFFRLPRDRAQQIGLALLVSGGIGNLWDRVLYHRVVDFMNMGFGVLRTGIFNVADAAIMAGIVLLAFSPYLSSRAAKKVSTLTSF